MTEWYQRQFGDQAAFAVSVALGQDPHPSGDAARDALWGSLELWAGGKCLTASESGGGTSRGIRWTLLPVIEWLLDVGLRLVNEDPYPRFSKGSDVGTGAAWYDATIKPPVLDAEAEHRWFLRRSEWRHHHALRRAAEDVALPNVVFRRAGDDIEISWDNEGWAPPRPDLRFVERRGRELTAAGEFARVLREALVDVLNAATQRHPVAHLLQLTPKVANLVATNSDWRWLVHRPTANVIRAELPALAHRLDHATAKSAEHWFVPHTRETRVLRHVRAETAAEVEALLRFHDLMPKHPLAEDVRALLRPGPAAHERPWDEGNDYADIVREALGWGIEPLPDLKDWLVRRGAAVPTPQRALPLAVAVFSARTHDACALVYVSPKARTIRRETGYATALGHLLLDDVSVAIDGDWEHWPTAARARAFGIALMLPEEGVREVLKGATTVGDDELRAVMRRYGTGRVATAHRLRNLGIVSQDEELELLQDPS